MNSIGFVYFFIFTTGTLTSIGVFVKGLFQKNKNKEIELIELNEASACRF